MLIAGLFVWEATNFRPKAYAFPFALGGVVIFLSFMQFIKNGWDDSQGQVLDLGMMSEGIEGRGVSALKLFGLIGFFLLLATLIGLQYAAIILAVITPALLMTGERPWLWGLLTGGLIAAAVFGLFDHLLNVIWPERILWDWIQATF
jgi:hypothetical protein